MKTLQIDIATARGLYPDASPEFRTLLEKNFSMEALVGKITDRIRSYEDACNYRAVAPINEKEMLRMGFRQDEIDRRKLEVIAEALNEGEFLDWNNSDQAKYYPWFNFDTPSGFALGGSYYGCSGAFAGDASRLCFKSAELARYAGEQFLDLWKSIIDNRPRA